MATNEHFSYTQAQTLRNHAKRYVYATLPLEHLAAASAAGAANRGDLPLSLCLAGLKENWWSCQLQVTRSNSSADFQQMIQIRSVPQSFPQSDISHKPGKKWRKSHTNCFFSQLPKAWERKHERIKPEGKNTKTQYEYSQKRGEREAKLQLAKVVNGTQNFGDKVQSMVNYHPFQWAALGPQE